MRNRIGWKHALTRGTAALLATVVVALQATTAAGSPGDIFTTAAPVIGDAAPAATSIADGDAGVSTNTGAFTYSYPIAVPPGRNGMQPSISLTYSSQASIYGGLAAGWSISGLPIITEDTRSGRLWSSSFSVPVKRYQSSMAGGRPLVVVNEPAPAGTAAYRAQNDASFVRYQQSVDPTVEGYHWRALSPDGTITYFGHTDAHAGDCTTISDGYAPVTRIEDPFGNLVDFYYRAGVEGECRITAITWGQHVLSNGAGTFAQVLFTYVSPTPTCYGVPIGSQTSYRTGTKIVTGASKLDKIEAFAFAPTSGGGGTAPPLPTVWEHHRTIELKYSEATASCQPAEFSGKTPYRALASIKEIAVGIDAPLVELPQIDFTYGDAGVYYNTSQLTNVPWPAANLPWSISPADRFNLGWGLRPDLGAWPTVEAMMLDVDGDGLIDRIQNEPLSNAQGKTRLCQARWYRNKGVGQFEDRGLIEIPTIKWASPGSFSGGAHATENQAQGLLERCALNYQRSGYRNSNSGTGYVGSCPPNNRPCPNQISSTVPGQTQGWCTDDDISAYDTKSDCGDKTLSSDDTHFAWRWMDMNGDQLPDLVGSPVTGGLASYDLQWGNKPGATMEPSIFGDFQHCPSTRYTADPTNWANEPYTMCGGMFPWFVYLNRTDASGRRVFGQPRPWGSGTTHDTWGPLPDEIMYQPVPLETASGESSLTSRPLGQFSGMVDVDGDGFTDAVHRTSWDPTWKVFRNDGTGQLLPALGTDPFLFGTGAGSNFYISRSTYVPAASNPTAVEGLEDFNGDGLVDHWVGTSSPANVHLNDGRQFRTTDGTTIEPPGPHGVPHGTLVAGPDNTVCTGTRRDVRRTIDVDADGRADLFDLNEVRFNIGGQFSQWLSDVGDGGWHHINLRSNIDNAPCTSSATRWWEISSDLFDLDGDGLKEDVLFSSTSQTMNVAKRLNSTAPRLLTSIKNNRGATTTITYSSSNGPAVVQAPDQNKASPSTNWVVQGVTTVDAFAGTTTTTSYKYKHPRWAPDGGWKPDGTGDTVIPHPSSFRGFEEVETTAQSGAVTIERFSYAVDWSGRLVTKIVKPSSGSSVHTIDDTTWELKTLFSGNIKTYHAIAADHWTCKNGQDESTCRANTDTRTHSETTWTDLNSTSPSTPTKLLWQATSTRLGTGATLANGDREITTSYALVSDATNYRLRREQATKNHRVAGGWAMYGKSVATWDPDCKAQLTEETWVDGNNNNRTIAGTEYDMTTGNVVATWKPQQFVNSPANPAKTVITYDSRKLFPATETSELGHVREYTWEYGTGTKLVTEGPNARTCVTGPGCPADATHPMKEKREIKIDGLGRVLERWSVSSSDGSLFTFLNVETNSYAEATLSTPASVTHRARIDDSEVPTPRWTRDVTEFDGHGRTIRVTNDVLGSAPANAITTYQYRDDGALVGVAVPNPGANDASTVLYEYGYDSLGRPVSIRRPDAATPTERSGVDITYDGLTQTTTEVVKAGDGLPASTRTTNDSFGRLLLVEEKASSNTWQASIYTYGPDDLVRTITDPEGVKTALTHDWAGRRTKVTRPGGTADSTCVDLLGTSTCRHWKYTYDFNGNIVAEQVPGSTSAATDINYITSTVYDAQDRPVSKVIGPRTLSTADQSLFDANTEAFAWDAAGNGKGRLRQWVSYNKAGQWISSHIFWFDAQSKPFATGQQFRGADYATLVRDAVEGWSPLGIRTALRHREFVGPNLTETWTKTNLDLRGLPVSLSVISRKDVTGQANYFTVGEQTRNVAGLVTKRRTNVTSSMGSAAMGYVESNWTYDNLGRVVDQTVLKGPSGAQVVRQQLQYFGNDDPKTLTHHLGSSSRTFTFGYDERHQLTSANADLTSYFTSSYTYGDAGRLSTVNISQTSPPLTSEVNPRHVDYIYDGTDPEQVASLVHADGPQQGSPLAEYTYDAAGNQLTRSYPETGELWEYVYDGKDQLRRATKKQNGNIQGSEEYWYDHTGARTQTVKRDPSGNKSELIWFLKDTEYHYDASGNLAKTYAHSNMGTPVARIERTPAGGDTPTFEFQFHGLASHTLAAVAVDGTVNASFSYTPFGDVLETTNDGGTAAGTAAHKRRFNDKYQDDISALGYYGFRYYDKYSMTWTQSDPLYRFAPDAAWADPRRSNLYTFSLNSPLRYIDPDGHDVMLVGREHPTADLSEKQILTASARPGSFTVMSNTAKAVSSVSNLSDMKKALSGRTDGKVAYFGHASISNSAELQPTSSDWVYPEQFADAIGGMKQKPTDIFLFGCDTEENGFAEKLSKLLPGVVIHGYSGDFIIDARMPTDEKHPKGDPDKATLNPRDPSARRTHKNSGSGGQKSSSKPADFNGDGNVSDNEESAWMRSVQ